MQKGMKFSNHSNLRFWFMLPAKFFTGVTDSHNFFHNETNINFITMNHLFCDETIKLSEKNHYLYHNEIQWSPALYLSVKQIMDESVDSVKKITVAVVFSLFLSFCLNQLGHAVLTYFFFSSTYVTNVISKISEIWFSY